MSKSLLLPNPFVRASMNPHKGRNIRQHHDAHNIIRKQKSSCDAYLPKAHDDLASHRAQQRHDPARKPVVQVLREHDAVQPHQFGKHGKAENEDLDLVFLEALAKPHKPHGETVGNVRDDPHGEQRFGPFVDVFGLHNRVPHVAAVLCIHRVRQHANKNKHGNRHNEVAVNGKGSGRLERPALAAVALGLDCLWKLAIPRAQVLAVKVVHWDLVHVVVKVTALALQKRHSFLSTSLFFFFFFVFLGLPPTFFPPVQIQIRKIVGTKQDLFPKIFKH
jgi:hypothetical protein